MVQQILVILIVAVAAGWLGVLVWRFFHPRKSGKVCGGNCCDGPAKSPDVTETPPRLQMISSDDLRARLKARRR